MGEGKSKGVSCPRKCDGHLLLRTSRYAAGAVQSLITAPFDGDQYVGGVLRRTRTDVDAGSSLFDGRYEELKIGGRDTNEHVSCINRLQQRTRGISSQSGICASGEPGLREHSFHDLRLRYWAFKITACIAS